MKASELMIGDWVNCTIDGEIYPGKITKLDGETDDVRVVFLADPEDWEEGDSFEEIKPIPLTPEILKKNGFTEQRGSLYVIDKREEYIGICLYRNTMRFTHEVYCSNVEDPDELLYSQELEFESYFYVHELQHLLRLCKIDKEIEL